MPRSELQHLCQVLCGLADLLGFLPHEMEQCCGGIRRGRSRPAPTRDDLSACPRWPRRMAADGHPRYDRRAGRGEWRMVTHDMIAALVAANGGWSRTI